MKAPNPSDSARAEAGASVPVRWALRDGRFVPYEQLLVHAETLAMRYGLCAFEGIRGYVQAARGGVACFALDEHLERLWRTLELIHLPLPDRTRLRAQLQELLERNRMTEDCYLRIAVHGDNLGDMESAIEVSLTATVKAMGRKRWMSEGGGMSVALGPRQKPNDMVLPQRAKVIANYAGPWTALVEARSRGFDSVVLLTADGHLAEAPTANLFLYGSGVLRTPDIGSSILAGITRAHVIALAREAGIDVVEGPLTIADAHACEEAFLCGTGLEIAPIGRFDSVVLPRSARPVCSKIVARFFERVRNIPERSGVSAAS